MQYVALSCCGCCRACMTCYQLGCLHSVTGGAAHKASFSCYLLLLLPLSCRLLQARCSPCAGAAAQLEAS